MDFKARFISSLWVLILAAAPAAASPVVINGNFDEAVPRNGAGGGWTTAHIDGAGGWQSGVGLPAPCYRLNDAGSGSSDPQIWQTVDGFEPGQVYTLRGDYALGVALGSPDNSFEVRVDGVAVLTLGPAPEHQNEGTVFRPFEVSFEATSTSHVIELAAETNSSDHDYYVDSIRFEELTAAETTNLSAVKALYR